MWLNAARPRSGAVRTLRSFWNRFRAGCSGRAARRALISTMLFSFARVSAVLSLKRQDFYYQGPRRWLRFHEKGGKEHEMPAHHEIEQTIDEYLSRVGIEDKQPLFQSVNKTGTALTGRALNRHNAWAAIRKRARNAGFLDPGRM